MVCHHCVEAVGRVIRSAGLTPVEVTLGRAEIREHLDDKSLHMLDSLLSSEEYGRTDQAGCHSSRAPAPRVQAQLISVSGEAVVNALRHYQPSVLCSRGQDH